MNEMYTYTVPIFIKMLGGLKRVLSKAQEAVARGVLQEEKLISDALAPDMFAFARQVQVACDQAKGVAARLSGSMAPKFQDSETTLAQLQERIDKTLEYLKTITPEMFEGAASRKIELPYFPGKYMEGFEYAREYGLPNFFFHITTAYNLVRRNGVEVGKADFVNGLPLKNL